MTGWIGVDAVAVELRRAEREDTRARDRHVLHHDVEVKLLRHGGVRPRPGRRWPGASWNARPDEESLAATTTQSSL